ncbi:MAG: dihydropteroate synthase-like protein, partial [Acidilobaceae archaeon]
MKIALVTSRTAKPIVEDYVRRNVKIRGVELEVVSLPLHAISMVPADVIARIARSHKDIGDALGGSDIILVPGTVLGDVRGLSMATGRPAYKASKALSHLPQVLNHIAGGGALDTVRPAEEVISLREPEIEYVEAFKINGLSIPLKGPPIILASEIVSTVGLENLREKLSKFISEGAQVIVIGSSFDTSPEELASKVSYAVETGHTILAEAPTGDHAREALGAGAHGIIVSTEHMEASLEHVGGDKAIVIGDRSVEALARAYERAREAGISKIIVDPVVGVPLVDFASTIARYREASRIGCPTLFSSANVVEEVEADTHGVHAILAALAVELGASIYLVVEDSYKSMHSTAEAREALRVASGAYARKTTMRGSFSRLLIVKQQNPPEKPTIKAPGERVDYIEPRWDKRGYVRVEVDAERGVIIASYIGYKGETHTVEGRHATSVARALVRKAGLDPEHAAYLGYELAKAEIALKLGKSYIQDSPLINTP